MIKAITGGNCGLVIISEAFEGPKIIFLTARAPQFTIDAEAGSYNANTAIMYSSMTRSCLASSIQV